MPAAADPVRGCTRLWSFLSDFARPDLADDWLSPGQASIGPHLASGARARERKNAARPGEANINTGSKKCRPPLSFTSVELHYNVLCCQKILLLFRCLCLQGRRLGCQRWYRPASFLVVEVEPQGDRLGSLRLERCPRCCC